MDLFSVLSAIISLVALIVFFVMASNISDLKKQPRADAKVNYYVHFSLGNNTAAHEQLLYMFYYDLSTYDSRRKGYDELRKKYEDNFRKLGVAYPDYI